MSAGAPLPLDEVLSRRGIDLADIRIDHRGTIVPPPSSLDANLDALVGELPILLDGEGVEQDQLRLGPVLGEGGMGEVRLAEQIALRRPVAVKVQHGDAVASTATLQLLREARVTGLLEHPNIVPIHALGRDPSGRPHIVMKRIEGQSWSAALAERPVVADDDHLVFHVQVLLQVLRALSFAHSRGVLHLDVKPDNVMLGPFDEIYLVDWGVAVRTTDEPGHPDIPRNVDVEHILGTPHYMAPELVAAEGVEVTERTDVYLAGACLHHVLTGEAPHQGGSLRAVLSKAFLSAPASYAERWPRELVSVVHRAMHARPEARYASAAELRAALEAFLRRRHARTLSQEARERLRQLEAQLTEVPSEGPDGDATRALYDTFSACRFGYDLALREWPEDRRARDGLQRCLERMIVFELAHGSAGVAGTYLNDLPTANPELAERVSSGKRRAAAKGEAFERLRRDADVTVGDGLRGVVALCTGVAWGVSHIALGVAESRTGLRVTPGHLLVLGSTFWIAALLVTVVGRRVFLNTAANTRTSVGYVLGFLGYAGVCGVAIHNGLTVSTTLGLFLVCSAMLWLSLALGSDRRLLPLPAAQATGALAITVLPNYALEMMGATSLIGPLAVAFMWLGRRPTRSKR